MRSFEDWLPLVRWTQKAECGGKFETCRRILLFVFWEGLMPLSSGRGRRRSRRAHRPPDRRDRRHRRRRLRVWDALH